MNINEQIQIAKNRPVLTGVLAVIAVISAGASMAFATGMTAPQLAEAFVPLPPCCVVVPPPPPVTPPPVVPVVPVVPVETDPDPLPPCCEVITPPVTEPPVTTPVTPVVPVEVEPDPPVVIVEPPYVPPVDPPEIIDVCPNIGGPQASIPSGKIVDEHGNCVNPPPVVQAPECILDASPKSINRGETSRLNWATERVTSVRIDNGVGTVAAVGYRDVAPTQTTTYTLTATGTNGQTVNCYTTIIVKQPQPEPVCTLTASPTTINKGGSSTLSWTTQNATSVSINQGIGAVAINGSRSVSPAVTTTYILTASGNGKTVNCDVTITVVNNPELPVCTLSAHPTTITRGSAATLTWTTDNATQVSINQGIGSVSLDGSRSVMPQVTTTYVLTATGNGKTVNCQTTITVVVPEEPKAPVCTLTVSTYEITKGGSAQLAWTTQNATSIVINQGIGPVGPNGTRNVMPTQTTTYVLTATGHGKTVNCDVTIVVKVNPEAPVCTLTAQPTKIMKGSAATLIWSTTNATSVSIDQNIGSVALDGSRTVMPQQTTTYTLTASGNGKTVYCPTTIVVEEPQPEPPVCTLTVSPSSITRGGSATLTWSTTNATSVSIDQNIGSVSLDGSRSVSPTQTTTYTLTATGNGKTVNCPATVTVTTPDEPASCYLRIDKSRIDEGERATLTWGGTNIRSVRINQGIGEVGASGSQTIRPRDGRQTYVGTFTTTKGNTITCKDTIEVDEERERRDRDPDIDLDLLPFPDDEPLAFVYLSDMPYTGLDLGPLGTALYWSMLVLWSAAAAYLVLFNGLPMLARKMQAMGTEVGHAVNSHDTHAAPAHHVAHSVAAPAPIAHAPVKSYSSYEGFRSFAKNEGSLTIDDIVSGLAREQAEAPVAAPVAIAAVAPIIPPTYAPVAAPAAPARVEAVELADDIPGFIAALLNGDKDATFGIVRNVTRQGGSSEEFLTQAVCALDEAYRAKLDGSTCHPEIARLTKDCAPTFLERLVGSLATAVDGTYSAGVTGVKLAVTRALSVVNG